QFTAYNPFADDAAPAADVFGAAASDEGEPAAAPVVDDSDKGRTYRAMQNLLEEIVSEVRRSIDYYRSRGDEVDQILLCGGGANLKGLASYMGESLSLPCDTFDAARRLNVSAKRLPAGFMDEHRAEFAVAIGNGLHALID
ncbi:MAG: pilus assembly protein PilM, partial [Fimbriimonadaceae bacterium]|nr:pilus assembly protein PilM [Fimbriimonadaceae bacterium]